MTGRHAPRAPPRLRRSRRRPPHPRRPDARQRYLPQPPAVAVPAAEPADVSAASTPAVDVEQRQDAKIARGLVNADSGGVLVVATPEGSVAGALHLQPGDRITAVHGQPLTSTEQFVHLYRTEGLPAEMTVQRAGREVHVH